MAYFSPAPALPAYTDLTFTPPHQYALSLDEPGRDEILCGPAWCLKCDKDMYGNCMCARPIEYWQLSPAAPSYEILAPQTLELTELPRLPLSRRRYYEPPTPELAAHLWGYLEPLADGEWLYLFKDRSYYRIGWADFSDYILPGTGANDFQCGIYKQTLTAEATDVMVQVFGSNGILIDRMVKPKHGKEMALPVKKVADGSSAILLDGDEITFGRPSRRRDSPRACRYICHLFADDTRLAREYKIGYEIARGSYGIVKYATRRADNQAFAVKMLSKSNFDPEVDDRNPSKRREARERAYGREISLLRDLGSECANICQLEEAIFEENGDISLVLELVDYSDLCDYIANNDGLDEDAARDITAQLCYAMIFLQKRGIAHRDLKPENILLTADAPPMVKVADFGMAKFGSRDTPLRTKCGTPIYTAPEVTLLSMDQDYDYRVDNWSVGLLVFTMLTNCDPFDLDGNELSQNFLSSDARAWVSRRKLRLEALHARGVSAEAFDFIEQLVQMDPAKRMSFEKALTHKWLCPNEHTANVTDTQGTHQAGTPMDVIP